MNKIVKDYIDGRIAAMKEYKGSIEDDKIDCVITIFKQLGPAMEDVSNERELKVAKKEIKDCLLEAMDITSIADEKRRALTIQAIYNVVDYHHDNVNSLKAINEFAKDMGMSIKEYLAFSFRLALEMVREEEKGNSRSLDL
jgi:hypothetical protein